MRSITMIQYDHKVNRIVNEHVTIMFRCRLVAKTSAVSNPVVVGTPVNTVETVTDTCFGVYYNNVERHQTTIHHYYHVFIT